jgi:hypothetical protein
MKRGHLISAAALLVLTSCQQGAARDELRGPETRTADVLHDAVRSLTGVIVYDIFSPPQASRVYAYAGVAAYEAARQGSATHRSLAGQLNGLTPVPEPAPNAEYALPLAAVHAFTTVGRALTFSRARVDSIREALDGRFRGRLNAAVYERSIAYGDQVAEHILAWAGTDKFKESRGYPKYTVTPAAGRWIPTPPAYMDAVEPNWAMLRPFTLDSASQFRPEPPHPFDTAQGSAFMREAREVYDVTKQLTADQKDFVYFWDDNPYVMHVQGHTMFATKKATPGGHWMGIVAAASRQANFDIVQAAAAYARTAIALADGFISCWDEKFRSNVIRPETVINAYIDDTWRPLLQTPPFPEYTSGHSVISTSAAVVLTDEFGEEFSFTDSTALEYGLTVRAYPSFRAAAEEAAVSRLYGGIHFRRAIEQGQSQGRHVGEHVVRRTRTATTIAGAQSR